MTDFPESIFISDQVSGACAEILPGRGFNCRSFRVPTPGETVDVIWTPDEQKENQDLISSLCGIPILFPFAGRIRDGRFSFEQKEFQLSPGDGLGNAIHGFLLDRAWQIVEICGDRLMGRFDASVTDPQILDFWPADFQLTITYRVTGKTLHCEFIVENKDPVSALPCAFGLHPYFRIPLGQGRASQCRVVVPAEDIWELDNRLLPTGRRIPAAGMFDLREGRPFPELDLDHVFGGLRFHERCCTILIEDGRSNRSVWMKFPDLFQYCVVFTPPHRDAICVEPYTSIPDPFTMTTKVAETGLKILSPGQIFRGWVRIGVD